jgi:hypothetical protein
MSAKAKKALLTSKPRIWTGLEFFQISSHLHVFLRKKVILCLKPDDITGFDGIWQRWAKLL